MATDVVRRDETAIARPLKSLVPLIRAELDAGDAAGVEHYRRAGEMLLEAKSQVSHGEWQGWLQRNFHRSERQALKYMQLARIAKSAPKGGFETLQDAVAPNRHAEPARSWQPQVRQIAASIDVGRMAQERDNRERERRLLRELAHKVVDIGYRVLATKLHPDKPGGSTEAMKRLNEVRRLLKEAV